MPKIHIGRTLISTRINWNGLKRLEQPGMGRNSTKGGTRSPFRYTYQYEIFQLEWNLYITKNWNVAFNAVALAFNAAHVKPRQHPRHYLFSFHFLITIFNIFFNFTFTLLQPFSLLYLFISPLLLQSLSFPHLLISPLPFTLISFFILPFIFLYFCLFLFTPSYYKFVTISFILCVVFPYTKKVLSLSLSLSLTHTIFGWIFIFYFSCIFALG